MAREIIVMTEVYECGATTTILGVTFSGQHVTYGKGQFVNISFSWYGSVNVSPSTTDGSLGAPYPGYILPKELEKILKQNGIDVSKRPVEATNFRIEIM